MQEDSVNYSHNLPGQEYQADDDDDIPDTLRKVHSAPVGGL